MVGTGGGGRQGKTEHPVFHSEPWEESEQRARSNSGVRLGPGSLSHQADVGAPDTHTLMDAALTRPVKVGSLSTISRFSRLLNTYLFIKRG